MEEDQEDLKLINDFIHKQKSSYQSNLEIEFEDFVSYKQEPNDQNDDDDDFEMEVEDDPLKLDDDPCSDSESNKTLLLTAEEQDIVDSCTDPDLKRVLILNRTKNLHLMNLQRKIQDLMLKCTTELEETQSLLENIPSKPPYQQTYLWKLAAPYFKDKRFYPSPRNADTKRRRAEKHLSIYDLDPCPKWTPIEFDRLTNAVKCNYNINRQKAVMAKITSLKAKMQDEDGEDKSVAADLIDLKEQLEDLKSDEKLPPLNSDENIDWHKVSDTFLKNKHTYLECQSVWHILVHPQINKSEWTDEENKKLETIAKKNSFQNWEKIASELQTNRTGFTTCLHYFSKLCDKLKKFKFSEEEDSQLLQVIELYKIGNFIPWCKVACHFTNRSRHQLYHRYRYFLSQNHVKKGKFSEAEDILLIILVNKFGRNFAKCAEYMPNRSQVQLKSRYNSNLQRPIKKGTFTSADDEIIYEYAQKHGEKGWSGLTAILHRCNAQIRQRYKLIKTFLEDNPTCKIADIPKRKHNYEDPKESGQHNFINYIAEQYKNVDYIPSLSMIEDCLQHACTQSSETTSKSIDDMLIDAFSTNVVIKKNGRSITETNLKEATENVEQLLKLLGVNIEIPDNLTCSLDLDNIDLEILENLSKNAVPQTVNKFVPPNLSTLVGLKTLIISHKEYKTQHAETVSTSLMSNEDSIIPPEIREQHRELFRKRFEALFTWSAILSLEKPDPEVLPEHPDVITVTNEGTAKKRKPEVAILKNETIKKPVIQYQPAVKKRKISVKTLTELTHHPQLRLVDKSVVQHLMRQNKNINVIRIESVTGSDGVVKSVLQQDSCSSADPLQADANVNDCDFSDTSSEVTNSDLHDVETLDSILKRMKSETKRDFGPGFEDVTVKNDPD